MALRTVSSSAIFQSTCLREARPAEEETVSEDVEFQSTCLREARPVHATGLVDPEHFNPRAYVRHDIKDIADYYFAEFQSTCLREARPFSF